MNDKSLYRTPGAVLTPAPAAAAAPCRVYVASPFSCAPEARAAMAALRAEGFEISHDWTSAADEYPDDNAPPHVAERHARDDMRGVRAADVVLLLTSPKAAGRGCWLECGAALALGIPVVCVQSGGRPMPPFVHMFDFVVANMTDAIAACRTVRRLVGLAANPTIREADPAHIHGPAVEAAR